MATVPIMIFRIACQSGSSHMSETQGKPAIPIIVRRSTTMIKVILR